jgi:hypothetical protein
MTPIQVCTSTLKGLRLKAVEARLETLLKRLRSIRLQLSTIKSMNDTSASWCALRFIYEASNVFLGCPVSAKQI